MYTLVTRDGLMAIGTVSRKRGYTICRNVPGQRREWKTKRGALSALDIFYEISPLNTVMRVRKVDDSITCPADFQRMSRETLKDIREKAQGLLDLYDATDMTGEEWEAWLSDSYTDDFIASHRAVRDLCDEYVHVLY